MSTTPSKPTRTRGGVQPDPITLDAVVDAALRVVELIGLDGLTIKAVADELGVSSPAVYHYVPGKAELVIRVCERVTGAVSLEVSPEDPWDQQIMDIVQGMGATYSRYPGVGPKVLAYSGPRPAGDAVASKIIDIAIAAGHSEIDAARLCRALQLVFGGWLLRHQPHITDRFDADASIERELQEEGLSLSLRYVLAGFAVETGLSPR